MTENQQYSGYFRCGGCGRFVGNEAMQKHYETNHKEGIAIENPPAPTTVSNPPPMPMFQGHALPPIPPHQEKGSIGFDILYMKRSYPKAFIVYTGIIALLTALFISSVFVDILIFHL